MVTRVQQFPHSLPGAPGPHTTSYLALTDTPGAFVAEAIPAVNAGGTAMAFSPDFKIAGPALRAVDAAGPAMLNVASSGLVPGFAPNRLDLTSGLGGLGFGTLHLIVGGLPILDMLTTVQRMAGTFWRGSAAGSFQLANETSTNTNPTVNPSFTFPSSGMGGSAGNVSMIVLGTEFMRFSDGAGATEFLTFIESATAGGPRINPAAAGAAIAGFIPNKSAGTTGWGAASAGVLSAIAAAVEVGRFDSSVVADDIRLMLYDVTAGTLKRVSRGAVDSGGTGFRALRMTN